MKCKRCKLEKTSDQCAQCAQCAQGSYFCNDCRRQMISELLNDTPLIRTQCQLNFAEGPNAAYYEKLRHRARFLDGGYAK